MRIRAMEEFPKRKKYDDHSLGHAYFRDWREKGPIKEKETEQAVRASVFFVVVVLNFF